VVRVSGYRSRGLGSIPGLPDFLRNDGSVTGSTHTREYKKEESSGSGLGTENTAVEIRRADHATHSIRKNLALTSPTRGGRSVGIVRSLRSRSFIIPLLHVFYGTVESPLRITI
jgi:hypothetical protein